jgi:hypothetical protein
VTIQINKPELEALIQHRLRAGKFHNVEDMLLDALGGDEAPVGKRISKRPAGRKSLAQLFAESPLKGLDLKFERDPDTGRSVEL